MELWELAGRLASIVLLDLVLSGDNAVVIGMATRTLAREQRRRAIVLGGAGAVVLRVIFTAAAALLLNVPLLMAAGGLLLAWIALKLLRGAEEAATHPREAGSMSEAIRTIVLADVVMSLDNMLAVGGAAHGNLWLLLFGLVLSIPILLLGSGLVASLLSRFGWLSWLGAAILAWTAGAMIAGDPLLLPYLERVPGTAVMLPGLVTLLIVGAGLWQLRSRSAPQSPSRRPAAQEPTNPGG